MVLDKIHFKRDKIIYFIDDGPFSVLSLWLCLIFHFLFLFLLEVCFAFFV